MTSAEIVARLRRRRVALKLRQRDLAKRINGSKSAVGRWERRKHEPSLSAFCAWCEELGIRITLTDQEAAPCSDATSPPSRVR